MNWNEAIQHFKSYLLLERQLSQHSIQAYLRDIGKLREIFPEKEPACICASDIETFLVELQNTGLASRSQSRIISGLKSFFNFMILDRQMKTDPLENIDSPNIGQKIPEVLTIKEIEAILDSIDLSHPQGHRNYAIIETLYACGLRVSELIELKISNIHKDLNFIKVTGKNSKERLIPIHDRALRAIAHYKNGMRRQLKIQADSEDHLFLNRRGKKLTRVMIFTIVKNLAKEAEIKKNVSPHTFRHSFATHLVERGADLRVVQDLLGHESIITTEIYTHIDTQYLRETIMQFHPMSKR